MWGVCVEWVCVCAEWGVCVQSVCVQSGCVCAEWVCMWGMYVGCVYV